MAHDALSLAAQTGNETGVEYRNIPQHPGYRVGSDGTFWTCWKMTGGRHNKSYMSTEWKQLHPTPDDTGLMRLGFKGKSALAGRVLLATFCGQQKSMVCAYRDGNKSNLALTNLFWQSMSRLMVGRQAGSRHGMWQGDKVSAAGGRKRARREYRIDKCDLCGKPAKDRHHKDGNTANNSPGNIQLLCRRCHMTVDGRLAKFVTFGPTLNKPLPPKPCICCGNEYKPLRGGLCGACYSRRYRARTAKCGS